MTIPLKGRIFFIEDDFTYNDFLTKEFEHTVAKIENVVIDDNMLHFFIPQAEYLFCNYNVSLRREDIGMKYSGTFKNADDEEYSGYAECEVYKNEKRFFLYGQWNEDEITWTWWAIINLEMLS